MIEFLEIFFFGQGDVQMALDPIIGGALISGGIQILGGLFGGGAAAAIMLAIVVFRMEQKELLLNPLKLNREVNEDAIKNQGKGVGFGVITWVVSLITLIFFVDF